MTERPDWVRVARVLRPHGLGGELTVELLGGERGRLLPGMDMRGPQGEVRLESVRGDGKQLICRFSGIADRDAAANLSGGYLEVEASELRPLPLPPTRGSPSPTVSMSVPNTGATAVEANR